MRPYEAFDERPSATIPLIVRPGACGDEVVGWSSDALIVHVVADNACGAADAAVENLLAEVLGVERACVRVVAGRGCRAKWLAIEGCDEADIELRLPGRHAAAPPWSEADLRDECGDAGMPAPHTGAPVGPYDVKAEDAALVTE